MPVVRSIKFNPLKILTGIAGLSHSGTPNLRICLTRWSTQNHWSGNIISLYFFSDVSEVNIQCFITDYLLRCRLHYTRHKVFFKIKILKLKLFFSSFYIVGIISYWILLIHDPVCETHSQGIHGPSVIINRISMSKSSLPEPLGKSSCTRKEININQCLFHRR